jgi:hypothetical protein
MGTEKPFRYSEYVGFWTLSIIRYSKEHNFSETGSVSVLGGCETFTLLGPLERDNLSHWTDPVSEMLCSLKYRMIPRTQ